MLFSRPLRHMSSGVRLGDDGSHIIGEFHAVILDRRSPQAAFCKGKNSKMSMIYKLHSGTSVVEQLNTSIPIFCYESFVDDML